MPGERSGVIRRDPARLRIFEHRPLAVFSSAGDAERRRRPADIATGLTAVVLVVLGTLQRSDPAPFGDDLATLLHRLPDWSKTLLGGFFVYAAGYVVFVIVMAIVARDRPGLVRDLLVAGGVATLVATLIGRLASGDWPALEGALNSSGPRFPVLRIAIVTAVVMTASPHVVRPVRRLGLVAIVGGAIAAIALELGTLSAVLVAFGIGLGTAAAVRLIWGSPGGAPSLYRVRSALATHGIQVGEFTQLPAERGVVCLACEDNGGRALQVKVYGRDAADAQLFAKAWRFVVYRSGGTSLTVTRTQQVEHETLVSLLVARAGVATADVIDTLSTASGDKLLITVAVLTENAPIGPDHVESIWLQLDALRAARIAHGRLDAAHVHTISASAVAITDWSSATVDAEPGELARDAAAAMVLTASVAGEERAVETAMAHLGEQQLIEAVSYLQNAVLTGALRRSAKAAHVNLDSLRNAAAQRAGQPAPELVKLQRVKWTSLLMSAFLFLAIWFVIAKIAAIGLDTLVDAFKAASWGWLVVALFVGQLPRLADAISVMGACDQPLAFGPTVALEMSISFINLAVPSAAARVALEVRFFQKQGVAAAKALTFGALDSVSLFLTQLGDPDRDRRSRPHITRLRDQDQRLGYPAEARARGARGARRRTDRGVRRTQAPDVGLPPDRAGIRRAQGTGFDPALGSAVRRKPAVADLVLVDPRTLRARVRPSRLARELDGDQRDDVVLRGAHAGTRRDRRDRRCAHLRSRRRRRTADRRVVGGPRLPRLYLLPTAGLGILHHALARAARLPLRIL